MPVDLEIYACRSYFKWTKMLSVVPQSCVLGPIPFSSYRLTIYQPTHSHSIPNQQKESTPLQIFLKIGTHVGSIGKPQNLAYFEYTPLRYTVLPVNF